MKTDFPKFYEDNISTIEKNIEKMLDYYILNFRQNLSFDYESPEKNRIKHERVGMLWRTISHNYLITIKNEVTSFVRMVPLDERNLEAMVERIRGMKKEQNKTEINQEKSHQ